MDINQLYIYEIYISCKNINNNDNYFQYIYSISMISHINQEYSVQHRWEKILNKIYITITLQTEQMVFICIQWFKGDTICGDEYKIAIIDSWIPHKDPSITGYYFKIFSSMYTNFWILIVFRKTQFFHKAFLISKREFSLCNHSFLFRFECTFVSTSSVECNTEILYLMPLLRNVIPYLDYLAR